MNRGHWFSKKNHIALVIFYGLAGCVFAQQPENNKKLPAHHTKESFQNPYVNNKHHGLFKYLKMRYFSDEEFADYTANAHKVPIEAQPDLGVPIILAARDSNRFHFHYHHQMRYSDL